MQRVLYLCNYPLPQPGASDSTVAIVEVTGRQEGFEPERTSNMAEYSRKRQSRQPMMAQSLKRKRDQTVRQHQQQTLLFKLLYNSPIEFLYHFVYLCYLYLQPFSACLPDFSRCILFMETWQQLHSQHLHKRTGNLKK